MIVFLVWLVVVELLGLAALLAAGAVVLCAGGLVLLRSDWTTQPRWFRQRRAALLVEEALFIGYDTMRFLAPRSGGCTLVPGQMPDQPSVQTTCPFADRSRVYVILPPRAADLPALRRLHPGGKVVDVGTWGYGSNHIIAYELPPGR